MTSTPVATLSAGSSSAAVAAAVTVLVLLVLIITVVIIIILIVVLKKRRMKYSNNLTSVEQTDGSSKKNNYTLKLGSEYEEMDDLDDKSATLSNKDSGHHNASTTYEDVEHGEKKGLVPSTNVTSGYEDIDEISSKNSKYYKSPMKGDIPAGGSDNVTADAESQIYNRLSRDVGNDQNRRQTNDTSDNTYSALESYSSPLISTTNDATDNMDRSRTFKKPPPKPMRRNTQGKPTDEPKEAAPPANPEKSEELEIYLDSNAANSKSRDNKVDDIYTVPCSNMSTLSQAAIASTSYSENPLYISVENDLNVNNVYSEPDLQQPSKLSEKTPVENIYESIYSESLQPSSFNQKPEEDQIAASTESDDLCPYSSIYTVPVIPSPQEKPLEVSAKNIRGEQELGSGQFGKVIMAKTVGLSFMDLKMGTSTDTTVSVPVAVKMLKASASQSTKKQFEQEYRFMFRLNHPNVIHMLGICTEGTPFIMMEYMENGDLNQILKHQYSSIVDSTCAPGDCEITQQTLINMCTQIASGMNYLTSNYLVHRDIATRNCLVGEDFMVKIADFGMSRSLYESHYYIIKGQAILPIRWMASECYYGKFSAKTDVWAFGCTMWEVFELSKHEPYYGMTDQEVVHDATLEASRSILSSPEGCPEAVYEIMKSCWAHEASERATFEELFSKLSALNV